MNISMSLKSVKGYSLLVEEDVEAYIEASLDNLKDQDSYQERAESMRAKIAEWTKLDGLKRYILILARPEFNTNTEEAFSEICNIALAHKKMKKTATGLVEAFGVIAPIGMPSSITEKLCVATGKSAADLFCEYVDGLNSSSKIALLFGATDTRTIVDAAHIDCPNIEEASANIISYLEGMEFTLNAEFVEKGSIQLEVGTNELNHWRTSISDITFNGIAVKFVEKNAERKFTTVRKVMRRSNSNSGASPLVVFLSSLKRINGVSMEDLSKKADEFGLENTPESKQAFLKVITNSLVEA